MDDTDRRLLEILREDARAPTAQLARALGLSRTTVQSRLERLERSGVITGYTVRLSDAHERGTDPRLYPAHRHAQESGSRWWPRCGACRRCACCNRSADPST